MINQLALISWLDLMLVQPLSRMFKTDYFTDNK